MVATTYKWRIEQWHELVNSGVLEGLPVELLEGDIVEMSPEGIEHSATNRSINDYLRDLLKGKAYISESHPITLDNSEPEPDIAVVRLPSSIYYQHHPYAEDIYWLIEVAAESRVGERRKGTSAKTSKRTLTKDLEIKTITYARNGIPEYWVVDLKNKQLIVHTQPDRDKYLQIVTYNKGTITPQAFPNCQIPLDKILLSF
jgi:Uma2 family endonuclease